MFIDNEIVEEPEMNIRVCHGSVISPLLFLIFKNDLPMFLPLNDIFMYAENTAVIASDNTSNGLENRFSQVSNYLKSGVEK